jgi:hypothetical protein
VIALLVPWDGTKPVEEVELPEGSQLDELQRLVGGFIEALPFPNDDRATAYVNEEGKYTADAGINRRATDVMLPVLFAGDWIAGDLVVCGFDPRRGENEDVTDKARRRVELVAREAGLRDEREPTIGEWGGEVVM